MVGVSWGGGNRMRGPPSFYPLKKNYQVDRAREYAQERKTVLKEVMTGSTSPVAFAAPLVVYKHLVKKYPTYNFTLREVRQFNDESNHAKDVIQGNRVDPKKDRTRKVIAYALDEKWQQDLVDMYNGKWVLAKVDVVSKKGDLIYIGKRKTPENVIKGLKALFLRNNNIPPIYIQTDKGGEFVNKKVRTFLKHYRVGLFTSAKGKATNVESFNRTWQKIYIDQANKSKKSPSLQKDLDRVVFKYNNREHSIIKMNPADVT